MEQSREELIRVGPIEMRFFVTGRDTAGNLDMFELTVPPGVPTPTAHFHAKVDEAVYVVEGVMAYRIGERRLELGAGERAFCPRGSVHHFSNAGRERMRVIMALSPATIGPAFFREVADLVNAGGPPDQAKMLAVMARYGLFPPPGDEAATAGMMRVGLS